MRILHFRLRTAAHKAAQTWPAKVWTGVHVCTATFRYI